MGTYLQTEGYNTSGGNKAWDRIAVVSHDRTLGSHLHPAWLPNHLTRMSIWAKSAAKMKSRSPLRESPRVIMQHAAGTNQVRRRKQQQDIDGQAGRFDLMLFALHSLAGRDPSYPAENVAEVEVGQLA